MVISLSGYDGMGKSTSVDLLMEKICENHGLKGMSALKANNGTEVYENIEQVDDIYKALSRYDVITTRFYFRSNKMQKLQEMVMFAETDVFDNTELIKEVTDAARQEAQIWYDHVIGKLLRKNKIIIYDRYYYDEIAYRSLYNLKKEYIERKYIGYPESNIRIHLFGDMDLIRERNRTRIDMKTALFNCEDKMMELYQNIEYISKKYNMIRMDIKGKTRDEVAEDLYTIVKFYINSAATSREEIGNGVHHGTVAKLKKEGIPVIPHRAVQMTLNDYEEYDYLIGMDTENIRNMQRISGGDPDEKIYKLLTFAGSGLDVADPWYTGDFEATYRDVLAGCKGLLECLKEEL